METSVSLTHDGIEVVDYPVETQLNVAYAAQAWENFLQLPAAHKEIFAAKELQASIGYEKKGSGERESSDIKENFDITRRSLTELVEKADSHEATMMFLRAADNLFDSLETMVIEYGRHVETTYGVTGFATEAAASSGSIFVRFLKYPPVPQGTVIGEAHVDHSGFTFHLYESTGGCERLSFDKKSWLPMPVAPDKAAAFASMQTQRFSNNILRGLCHQIIANHTTSLIGRSALVAFVPLVNVPSYDRKTHGRLQEKTPGFNYDIDQMAFRKLFTFS